MNIKEQYQTLVESLRLLAASYSTQLKVLPPYVDLIDEVVGTFEEAFYLTPEMILQDLISKEGAAYLIKLFVLIDFASRNEDLFTNDALRDDKRWMEIRSLAQDILKLLGEINATPDLKHIIWINK